MIDASHLVFERCWYLSKFLSFIRFVLQTDWATPCGQPDPQGFILNGVNEIQELILWLILDFLTAGIVECKENLWNFVVCQFEKFALKDQLGRPILNNEYIHEWKLCIYGFRTCPCCIRPASKIKMPTAELSATLQILVEKWHICMVEIEIFKKRIR